MSQKPLLETLIDKIGDLDHTLQNLNRTLGGLSRLLSENVIEASKKIDSTVVELKTSMQDLKDVMKQAFEIAEPTEKPETTEE